MKVTCATFLFFCGFCHPVSLMLLFRLGSISSRAAVSCCDSRVAEPKCLQLLYTHIAQTWMHLWTKKRGYDNVRRERKVARNLSHPQKVSLSAGQNTLRSFAVQAYGIDQYGRNERHESRTLRLWQCYLSTNSFPEIRLFVTFIFTVSQYGQRSINWRNVGI